MAALSGQCGNMVSIFHGIKTDTCNIQEELFMNLTQREPGN